MKRVVILAILILPNFFAWNYVVRENSRDLLTLAFMNVGQGDSIFIEAPNGNQIIIDSGPNESVIRQISAQMPSYDRTIDAHITTHPDLDHIGGTPAILERYNVGEYFYSSTDEKSGAVERVDETVISRNIATSSLHAGDKIILDKNRGVYLEVLWPPTQYESKDKNDFSIVARLVYGEVSAMLTGDASTLIEKIIASGFNSTKLKSNILKLGHHGSKTATSENFLKIVAPDYAIISAGTDNKYNHPSPEIVEKVVKHFQEQNKNPATQILKTTDGSVVFKSDGHALWVIK